MVDVNKKALPYANLAKSNKNDLAYLIRKELNGKG